MAFIWAATPFSYNGSCADCQTGNRMPRRHQHHLRNRRVQQESTKHPARRCTSVGRRGAPTLVMGQVVLRRKEARVVNRRSASGCMQPPEQGSAMSSGASRTKQRNVACLWSPNDVLGKQLLAILSKARQKSRGVARPDRSHKAGTHATQRGCVLDQLCAELGEEEHRAPRDDSQLHRWDNAAVETGQSARGRALLATAENELDGRVVATCARGLHPDLQDVQRVSHKRAWDSAKTSGQTHPQAGSHIHRPCTTGSAASRD
mmetsp:Transcript_119732/g.298654  ORF Transcript_119732/g.298654 Transcript_119732/m.298654 type:complete len:261 (+) Transcript_119732:478-1260(+)